MKRVIVLTMTAVMMATTFGVDAHAGAGKPRVYEGTLGDDGSMGFRLVKRVDRPLGLREFAFSADMTCDDGTTQGWFVGFAWGGRFPSLPSHAIDLDMVDPFAALHLHGVIQAIHGAGTLEWTIPALTVDEEAQLCTSGELPWTVDRTVPPVENPIPPPALQVLNFVATDGARVTMTRVA
jgi:hypothetical protein